jgi:hypothetical protein
MKIDKFNKIFLGLIAVLLLINLISGYLPSKSVQAGKHIEGVGQYEIFYREGIGRYQISSWAAQTGNAGYHHSGYYILDTVTGDVVDQSMEVHGPEE